MIFLRIFTVTAILLFGNAASACNLPHAPSSDTVTQYSTLSALRNGDFKGVITVDELSKHGNFGMGTFDGLDGEMMVDEGIFYHILPSGKVRVATKKQKVPFATLTNFTPASSFTVKNIPDYAALCTAITKHFTNTRQAYAIRIKGNFHTLKARSPHKQKPPYPLLEKVLETQTVHDLENAEGSMAGFWFPEYADKVNITGCHLHFVDAPHKQGGHVLETSVTEARVEIEAKPQWKIISKQ